ncbi:hypothetical protein F4818DRAFT_94650 [Hypoxylon cercidicola]|nr:hypothetical protein F4818DRAFT_94650 [Hypoxylon cercidicola]
MQPNSLRTSSHLFPMSIFVIFACARISTARVSSICYTNWFVIHPRQVMTQSATGNEFPTLGVSLPACHPTPTAHIADRGRCGRGRGPETARLECLFISSLPVKILRPPGITP